MESLTGFLKFITFGLVALGFYFGLTFGSAGSSAGRAQMQFAGMPNEYQGGSQISPQTGGTYERFIAECDRVTLQRDVLLGERDQLKRDLSHLEVKNEALRGTVRERDEQLRIKEGQINRISRELADTTSMLQKLRLDYAHLQNDYDQELEERIRLETELEQAARLIKQQQEYIQQQKQDVVQANRSARLYLIGLIVLVTLVILVVVLYWLSHNDKIDFFKKK